MSVLQNKVLTLTNDKVALMQKAEAAFAMMQSKMDGQQESLSLSESLKREVKETQIKLQNCESNLQVYKFKVSTLSAELKTSEAARLEMNKTVVKAESELTGLEMEKVRLEELKRQFRDALASKDAELAVAVAKATDLMHDVEAKEVRYPAFFSCIAVWPCFRFGSN